MLTLFAVTLFLLLTLIGCWIWKTRRREPFQTLMRLEKHGKLWNLESDPKISPDDVWAITKRLDMAPQEKWQRLPHHIPKPAENVGLTLIQLIHPSDHVQMRGVPPPLQRFIRALLHAHPQTPFPTVCVTTQPISGELPASIRTIVALEGLSLEGKLPSEWKPQDNANPWIWRRKLPVGKIVQLVLYSQAHDDYRAMRDLTSRYYRRFEPDIQTFYYAFDEKLDVPIRREDNLLLIRGTESFVPGILLKTMEAFRWVLKHVPDVEYVVRSNISTIVDLSLLRERLREQPIYYGGSMRLSHESVDFVSGTCIVIHRGVVEKLVDVGVRLDIIDDVSIGQAIFEHMSSILPLINLQADFLHVPNCGGDLKKLEALLESKKYAFYRNRSSLIHWIRSWEHEDRSRDLEQMKFILEHLDAFGL